MLAHYAELRRDVFRSPYQHTILLSKSIPIRCCIISVDDIRKGKATPVTGRGCDTSVVPHFLDNRLTDGAEVVNITRRPPFTPRKIPGTHFC
jgi:hypothetical protein